MRKIFMRINFLIADLLLAELCKNSVHTLTDMLVEIYFRKGIAYQVHSTTGGRKAVPPSPCTSSVHTAFFSELTAVSFNPSLECQEQICQPAEELAS